MLCCMFNNEIWPDRLLPIYYQHNQFTLTGPSKRTVYCFVDRITNLLFLGHENKNRYIGNPNYKPYKMFFKLFLIFRIVEAVCPKIAKWQQKLIRPRPKIKLQQLLVAVVILQLRLPCSMAQFQMSPLRYNISNKGNAILISPIVCFREKPKEKICQIKFARR